MNKKGFIESLSRELSYSNDKCVIINDVLESNFFISKKNKNKIIGELISELDINSDEACRIYDIAVKIINNEIKNALRHPFKSND